MPRRTSRRFLRAHRAQAPWPAIRLGRRLPQVGTAPPRRLLRRARILAHPASYNTSTYPSSGAAAATTGSQSVCTACGRAIQRGRRRKRQPDDAPSGILRRDRIRRFDDRRRSAEQRRQAQTTRRAARATAAEQQAAVACPAMAPARLAAPTSNRAWRRQATALARRGYGSSGGQGASGAYGGTPQSMGSTAAGATGYGATNWNTDATTPSYGAAEPIRRDNRAIARRRFERLQRQCLQRRELWRQLSGEFGQCPGRCAHGRRSQRLWRWRSKLCRRRHRRPERKSTRCDWLQPRLHGLHRAKWSGLRVRTRDHKQSDERRRGKRDNERCKRRIDRHVAIHRQALSSWRHQRFRSRHNVKRPSGTVELPVEPWLNWPGRGEWREYNRRKRPSSLQRRWKLVE